MKRIIFLITFVAICFYAYSQNATKVLYLGNSYTYTNDLPNVLEKIAQSQSREISSTEFLSGGARFMTHWNNPSVISKIQEGGIDFMILQGQSQEAAFPQGQFMNEVYPYAKSLDSLFKEHNPNGKVLFFMTWGYRYGDQVNCQFYPPFCNFFSMTQELYNNYRQMALDFNSSVAPIGAAWRYSIILDSNYVLHSSDNSHPSIDGTYLSACVLYSSIFKEEVNSSFYGSLSAERAQRYQGIANDIVMDSLAHWNLTLSTDNLIAENNINANVYYSEKEDAVKIEIQNIDQDINISIFDANAKLITQKTAKPNNNKIQTSINIPNIKKGLYIIKIQSDNFLKTFKVMI